MVNYNLILNEALIIDYVFVPFKPGKLQQIDNFESEPSVRKVISFFEGQIGANFSLLKIVKVLRQTIITGFYYEFRILLKYSQTAIPYIITVNENR